MITQDRLLTVLAAGEHFALLAERSRTALALALNELGSLNPDSILRYTASIAEIDSLARLDHAVTLRVERAKAQATAGTNRRHQRYRLRKAARKAAPEAQPPVSVVPPPLPDTWPQARPPAEPQATPALSPVAESDLSDDPHVILGFEAALAGEPRQPPAASEAARRYALGYAAALRQLAAANATPEPGFKF